MTPPNDVVEPAMEAPESGVRVRMYRPGGIGDCFLLAFRAQEGPRFMLIDCGVLLGTSGGAARLRSIADDIKTATGGHLHVLVATHQHWDHLSGFRYARETFEELTIDEVWVAWTEDPEDPLANRLREGRAIALRALTAAADRMKAQGDPLGESVERVLGFSGELGAAGSGTTADQMRYAVDRAETRFRRPGEPPVHWRDSGVRFYVLGPPVDEELLFRSNPSKSHSEVYELAMALHHPAAFYAAVLAAEGEDGYRELTRRSRPFDEKYRLECDFREPPAEHAGFFRERYGFADGDDGNEAGDGDDGSANGEIGPAWRRIDTDWLAAAGNLALALDGDTNNTSLVLAIELVESGKVLLFPADAQVGNWLSWGEVAWHGEETGAVRGTDLLNRTVLYKVGHHGSHNATLREKGLELMESPDLVAMIPVEEEQAEQKEWSMPFGPLNRRLIEKTHGRILRSDRGLPEEKPSGIAAKDWEAFLENADESDEGLWVEYTVEDDEKTGECGEGRG